MEELFAAWRFALQRLLAGWRLMLVAAVGVLAAATLLAVAPIYANAMSDLGLRFRLDQGLPQPSERVVHVSADNMLLGNPVQQATRRAMDEVTEARVGWLGPEVVVEERSPRLDLSFPAFAGQAPDEPLAVPGDADEPVRQPWGAFLFWVSGFEDHVTVTGGRLPLPSSDGAEVVLPDGFQRHAAIGDTIEVRGPRYDNCENVPASEDPEEALAEEPCRPSAFISTSATATVVGFVAPDDPDDLRWELFQADWQAPEQPFMPRLPDAGEPTVEIGQALGGRGSMPLLTTEEQYYGAFARRLPELGTRHRVGLAPDLDALQLSDVPRAIDDLHAWRADVNDTLDLAAPARLNVLDQLERFRNTQTFSQVPLLLILVQVVGIVLYYVVMVMGMLLDRQAEEIGVYRSRGASTSQLLGFTLVEGIALAVPAALLGPWLASQVVGLLGYTATFEPITGGSALPATITPNAYLLAAGGAALSLVAMLLPSFIAARRGIVDVKREQSRPAGRSFIQRYFLDFAVVGLAVLLLWQLDQGGSVFDPDAIGGWSSDPMLLLSPFVFTLAVAALVLRFYPPLLRLVVRVLLAFKGTAVAIGLRRAGRSPAAYARLMLLLVMATAVGTFAASYGPTVDRSLEERVRYDTGVDARAAIASEARRDAAEAVEEVRAMEGVRDATLVHRATLPALNNRQVPVIAMNVERAAPMLWSREDFAEESQTDLLARLVSSVPAGGGLPLADDATHIEAGMLVEGPSRRALVRVRFRDADGRFLHTVLEQPEEPEPGWFTASAEVPTHLTAPLTVVGLHVTDLTGQNLRAEGSITFDDFTAVRANGDRELLEGFESGFNWTMYAERDANESFEVVTDEALSGEQAARWTWGTTITPRGRILALADPAVPLAAVMNNPAMGTLGTGGDGLGYVALEDFAVPVSVRGTAELFPTMQPDRGFVIVNIDHLRSLSGTIGYDDGLDVTELWVDFEDSLPLAEQQAILAALEDGEVPGLRLEGSVRHQQGELADVRADPTLQASGSGILVVAFIAVLGLSTLGFLVTLVLGARARVTEFAVLRAVGSSRRQILRAMLLEWGVVLAIGGTIGVLLGRRVASVMLSFLDVTDEGARVLPPFILETNWLTLGLGVGLLVALVLFGLGVSWASAMRRAGSAQLRVTQ